MCKHWKNFAYRLLVVMPIFIPAFFWLFLLTISGVLVINYLFPN